MQLKPETIEAMCRSYSTNLSEQKNLTPQQIEDALDSFENLLSKRALTKEKIRELLGPRAADFPDLDL